MGYEHLLITAVKIGLIYKGLKTGIQLFLIVYLVYQVSDKRLLLRHGKDDGRLIVDRN